MKLKQLIFLLVSTVSTAPALFASDSLYDYSSLNFRLRSESGLTLQKNFPTASSDYPGTSYWYVEGKDYNQDYYAEIRIIDCREFLKNKSKSSHDSIWKVYESNVSKSRYPWPDTTASFKGINALAGGGKTVSGALHGNKKVAYKYLDFMNKGIIYSLAIFDRKKILNESFEDFKVRFELM